MTNKPSIHSKLIFTLPSLLLLGANDVPSPLDTSSEISWSCERNTAVSVIVVDGVTVVSDVIDPLNANAIIIQPQIKTFSI